MNSTFDEKYYIVDVAYDNLELKKQHARIKLETL